MTRKGGEGLKGQLGGKVALVTGASQGLGAAVARLFAERGAEGALLCARRERDGGEVAEAIASDTGCDARFHRTDVAKVSDCRAAVAACVEAFGRVDVLVNAAATTERGNILDTSEELFDEMFAVNVRGPYFLIQEAAKAMRERGKGGAVVNIGSVAALAGQPFISAYCASKGALAVLTKNTAFALMPDRIRVNCLNIGWMNTEGEDLTQRRHHGASDGWQEEAGKNLPFGRLLEPAEVAKAVAFLASDESGMMTGEALVFDQVIPGAFMTQPVPERLPD